MKYVSRVLAVMAILVTGLGVIANPRTSIAAPVQQSTLPGKLIQVWADPNVNPVRIPTPVQFSTTRAPLTTITINPLPAGAGLWNDTCVALPAQAQSAFAYAASIWASLVNSSVPIVIDVCWASNLPYGVLGHAGPQNMYRNFAGAPYANTWYTVALANSLAGVDLYGGHEIYMGFSSTFSWYYGTDGNPPNGYYDLVSVALHEMGHGLGFLGSMDVEDGSGVCNSPVGYGCYGFGSSVYYPAIYDRFTQDGAGTSLINYVAPYPSYSAALGTALRSNNVYFSWTNANAANGGTRVKLYAPDPWRPGSSYSHLDYSTFSGTINRLMVYAISSNAAIHNPGPVTLGIMKDLGWQITSTCYTLTTSVSPGSGGNVNANPAPNCNGTQYTSGTVVTLTANANGGYAFSSWSGDATGGTNPTTVTMNANKSVTANFTQLCYALSVGAFPSNRGSVNANPAPNCSGTLYSPNTNVTLTATANGGYLFSMWSGSIAGTTTPAIVTMNANKNISAIFSALSDKSFFLSLITK